MPNKKAPVAGPAGPLASTTKEQAERFCRELTETRRSVMAAINAIRRKRSWRLSEKARAEASLQMRLTTLKELQDLIEQQFGLGGW